MTDELIEAAARAIADVTDFDGDRMASRYADSELRDVARAAIRVIAPAVSEQAADAERLRKLIEAASAHFLRLNAEHPIMWEGAIDAAMEAVCLEVERQAAELAKWKALAETLAGALEDIATDGLHTPSKNVSLARGTLTSYKEQRDD